MSIIKKIQPKKTIVFVLVLSMLLVVLSVLLVSFSGCLKQTCAICDERGTISRELRYQVIDASVSEGGILDWKAWLTVTIKNLDDKTGYFTVTGTATGDGKIVTTTTGAFIAPGAVEKVVIELDIKFGQKYSYDYHVVFETIEVTCPGCSGGEKLEDFSLLKNGNVSVVPVQTLDGRIVSISFDKDKYYAGDTIIAELVVENTGNIDITSKKITIRATCTRLSDFWGNLALKLKGEEERSKTYSMSFSEIIEPRQTKTLSTSFKTLAEMEGISLAGDYDIIVKLEINEGVIDTKALKLTLY